MLRNRNPMIDVIATALVVLLLGFALELALGDSWKLFQRSGSLVVCVGIVFGALDLKSVYADRYEDLVRRLEEQRSENDIVFSDEELDAEVRGSTNYFKSRARSIRERDKKRVVLIVDTGVLMLGTVIGGFGDLFIIFII